MGAVDYLALLAGAGNTIAISAIAIVLGSPLGLMLALLCAVLLGEAAMRAGEIPAYGRRQHTHGGREFMAVRPVR